MQIIKKNLIHGAWWHYKLQCPHCKNRMDVSCPRGDEAVEQENLCGNGCENEKVVKRHVDKRTVRHQPLKRRSSKKSKKTTRRNKS